MSLKAIIKDQSGFTYTLEAILGIFLIMGTVVYVTTNMPYTAQKTGEHSKVQLVNIGRDNLDLTLITPIYETCPSCVNFQVYRQYLLCIGGNSSSDCLTDAFVKPNGTINFRVYYTNGTDVTRKLNFTETILGTYQPSPMTPITYDNNTYNQSYTFTNENLNEYLIQASDSFGVSNKVTVKVGYYFLDSNTNGIFSGGDLNISGVVYNATGGVPNLNLNITILDSSGSSDLWSRQCPPPTNNYTTAGGNFLFTWPTCLKGGLYYIQAKNNTDVHTSNMHLIVYSIQSQSGNTLWVGNPPSNQEYSVSEMEPVDLFETDKNGIIQTFSVGDINNFWVNNQPCNNVCSISLYNLTIIINPNDNTKATFRANMAGDYYVYPCGNSNNCNGQDIKTNAVLIHVFPKIPATGETQDNCVNANELNTYMRRYMPAYVNYNLYLINTTGNRFTKCPDFPTGELINGYPTAEAVTVYKLAHIKYDPRDIDNMVEFRIVMWYK